MGIPLQHLINGAKPDLLQVKQPLTPWVTLNLLNTGNFLSLEKTGQATP